MIGGLMKIVILFALVFSALNSFAETILTDVVEVEKINSEYVLFASDGQIYRLNADKDIEDAIRAKELGFMVEIQLDETLDTSEILGHRNNILGISLSSKESMNSFYDSNPSHQKNYSPADLISSYISDFDSEYQVNSLFQSLNGNMRRKSQCYNRAHVWSWELYRISRSAGRIQTGKMWLFFTRKYIREYDYKWWFHIAPYLTVQGQARVIDRTFTNGPLDERSWTNIFMQNNAACPSVSRYTDYENNQNAAYCYTIKTSVYYWQPWQIEGLEKNGQVRDQWQSYEVKKAYKNAFGWRARVPELD
tara:strand:- start:11309 stop:12226 length:918 start_codon:yes stop_codon:yes gene_type:complete